VVLAVSSRSGFIETVPNTTSIDVLRRSLPEVNSLAEYFAAAYGESGSARHTTAQRCFCESLAAYSLVCYLLQIKDRHNGNMLLDRHGHVIHIDYGFMFTSSPGQLGFESAPFKLTQDMVDVMGGVESDMFHYFQVLLLRGFLAVRRHNRKLLLLVRMMTHGGHVACLAADYAGVSAADSMRQRMQLHMTESECVAHILDLVSDSLESWSTHAYDYYQYYTNAIH
jgi:phosphatidylinositol kinase/protein kinase (PI-3  family)